MPAQLNPFRHIFRTKYHPWGVIKLSSFWKGRVFDVWRLFSGHPVKDEWGLLDYLLGCRFLEKKVIELEAKSNAYDKQYEVSKSSPGSEAPKYHTYNKILNFAANSVRLLSFFTKMLKWSATALVTIVALPFIAIVHLALKKEKNHLLVNSNNLWVQQVDAKDAAQLDRAAPQLKSAEKLETSKISSVFAEAILKPIKVIKDESSTTWVKADSSRTLSSVSANPDHVTDYHLAFFSRVHDTQPWLDPKDYECDDQNVLGIVDPDNNEKNKKALQAIFSTNRFRFTENIEKCPEAFEKYKKLLLPEERTTVLHN